MRKIFAEQGNYTQIHNYVLEVLLPLLTGNEWKILAFLMRHTVGWQTDKAQASYADIKQGTGIASDTTIAACLKTLLGQSDREGLTGVQLITKASEGRWDAVTYRLNLDFDTDAAYSKKWSEPTPKNGVSDTPKNGVPPYIERKEKERKQVTASDTAPLNRRRSPKGRGFPQGETQTMIRLPADFCVTAEMRSWAEKNLPPATLARLDGELLVSFVRKWREEHPYEMRAGLAAWVAKWKNAMTIAAGFDRKAERNGRAAQTPADDGGPSYDDLVAAGRMPALV